MDLIVCILFAIISLAFVLMPFFVGEGGSLMASSTWADEGALKELKGVLLAQYVKEEKEAAEGDLTAGAWAKRKQFLTNRYLDAARRLDFIQGKKDD